MVKSVLIAHAVADVCFLQEALYWLALGRLPLAWASEYSDDGRNNDKHTGGLTPDIDIALVTQGECEHAGIPINPVWDFFEEFHYGGSSRELKESIAMGGDPVRMEALQNELKLRLAFEQRLKAWEADLESHIDKHSARLFLALRDGKLVARGKRISQRLYRQLRKSELRNKQYKEMTWREKRTFEDSERETTYVHADWYGLDEEIIPKEYWISRNIDWKSSCAEGREDVFGLIRIDTQPLFQIFPIPETSRERRVSQVGSGFVFVDDQESAPVSTKTRGRPPYNWEEFNAKMLRRVRDGTLPPKQEAMISEMQAWCQTTWGRTVGESTLSQKIKPYYDVLIRGAEK